MAADSKPRRHVEFKVAMMKAAAAATREQTNEALELLLKFKEAHPNSWQLVAAALFAYRHGAAIVRVHDVRATRQAIDVERRLDGVGAR